MDITVYLPDEIGKLAKAAKLNLSALLRAAVERELERRDRLAEMAGDPQEFDLDLRTPNGVSYVGVVRGEQLTKTHAGMTIYQTADGRVVLHDAEREEIVPVVEPFPQEWYASTEDYIAVSAALGKTVRVVV